jgi:hypothetical protein
MEQQSTIERLKPYQHLENLKYDITHKYLEIKQDLMNNLQEVFLRVKYYTRKYRGNLHVDINVAISENELNEQKVQIFVRRDGIWIKDVMTYNSKGLQDSTITTNMYE